MKKSFVAAATMAACAFTAGQASAADFLGATVNYQYHYPDMTSAYGGASNGNKIVDGGIEVSNIVDGLGTMNISSNNILVDFTSGATFNSASFNGWILRDLTDNLSAITGVTVNGATNMAGFSASNLIWDANSIAVNWQGLTFNSSTQVSLDVTFADSAAAVPEPATWAMMLLGFAVIGMAMRRRQPETKVRFAF